MSLSQNLRILVVDDNPSIHEDFRKILMTHDREEASLDAKTAALFGNAPEPAPTRRFEIERHQQKPVICIELARYKAGIHKTDLKDELLGLAAAHELTRSIQTVLFHKSFPVDIRHNSKIFREKLAVWAEHKTK